MSERIICNDNGGELREEIVRCRDCKLVEEGRGIYADAWFCHHFSMTDRAGFPVRPSGFCAWGERRDA